MRLRFCNAVRYRLQFCRICTYVITKFVSCYNVCVYVGYSSVGYSSVCTCYAIKQYSGIFLLQFCMHKPHQTRIFFYSSAGRFSRFFLQFCRDFFLQFCMKNLPPYSSVCRAALPSVVVLIASQIAVQFCTLPCRLPCRYSRCRAVLYCRAAYCRVYCRTVL
jgi:hypothetical protein